MTRRSPHRFILPSMALGLALVGTACQGAGTGSPAGGASQVADAAVAVATSSDLGAFVVDAEGRTLYVFLNDSPGTSTCADDCATNWPPALADGPSPVAGDGVSGEVGVLDRDDGGHQLTLDGWPLYRYAGDGAAADTAGEGVGGVWFVARPDGSVPSGEEPSAEASAEDSGGYDPYDY